MRTRKHAAGIPRQPNDGHVLTLRDGSVANSTGYPGLIATPWKAIRASQSFTAARTQSNLPTDPARCYQDVVEAQLDLCSNGSATISASLSR